MPTHKETPRPEPSAVCRIVDIGGVEFTLAHEPWKDGSQCARCGRLLRGAA